MIVAVHYAVNTLLGIQLLHSTTCC